jgi:1-phosphatidylinositol-4-phosphate 5-kinase
MGAGRSPSYFFFTDNSMIMIKTMKKEEAAILFDEEKGILLDYVKHVCENPDSLLSKFLGIYAVQIKSSEPVYFFVTENMVGNDFASIRHMYDLKGSTLDRRVELTADELENG